MLGSRGQKKKKGRAISDPAFLSPWYLKDTYFFFLLMLIPARPIKPVPNGSIVTEAPFRIRLWMSTAYTDRPMMSKRPRLFRPVSEKLAQRSEMINESF